MKIKIGSSEFKNPIFAASGTFGYGEEFSRIIDINKLGAIVTKAVTLKPRKGNEGLRIAETPAGMINRIGLENVGLDAFINEKLKFLSSLKTGIIINIAGETKNEYVALAKVLGGLAGIHALEVNVSCPNVEKGGIEFSQDLIQFKELIKAVRKATEMPLIVKLSPSAGDILTFAKLARDEGVDAITVSNTFKASLIDTKSQKIYIQGGLSGPAIFPLALSNVIQVCKNIDIPVIASGGIHSVDTALQFFIAGAKAVQIGTFNFIQPDIALQIIKGITTFMREKKLSSINQIIGSLP